MDLSAGTLFLLAGTFIIGIALGMFLGYRMCRK